MRSGSCHTRAKYLLLAFNILLWLIGLAMVGLGIWILVADFDVNDGKVPTIISATLIAVGCVIIITGITGCHGTIKESSCRLLVFSVSLFLIFSGLLGAGVVMTINRESLCNSTETEDTVKGCSGFTNIVAGLSIGCAQVMVLGLAFSLTFHCTK
ncbi:tetraspanin-8-like [Haliotis rubra]|uniref:tetraspanin-8-like n=1 Tax=Haliotis rubra TaxID=36100 RepID=UPI001EE58CDE|nr:tetraspanin-8-like [Haliotis rubra]